MGLVSSHRVNPGLEYRQHLLLRGPPPGSANPPRLASSYRLKQPNVPFPPTSNGLSGHKDSSHGIAESASLRPQWCCHCKVVILGSGVRKSFKDLTFVNKGSRENSKRMEEDIVFCSNNCFILYSSTAQAKHPENKLPGVEACENYTFRYGRNPLMELPLAVNPTGCARSEPKMSAHVKRFVLRPHTLNSTSTSKSFQSTVTGELNAPYSKQFVHSKSSQYRRMKTEWKSNGLGLYAARDIEKHTMVIEYIGTIIRNEVANRKEKLYESQNRGVYMFRMDNDHVIDATLTGGPARYINHSCAPNCVAEVVTFERGHKIIISSNRRIQKGEEITFPQIYFLLMYGTSSSTSFGGTPPHPTLLQGSMGPQQTQSCFGLCLFCLLVLKYEGDGSRALPCLTPCLCHGQLCYDYKFDFEDDQHKIPCHCGAVNCRNGRLVPRKRRLNTSLDFTDRKIFLFSDFLKNSFWKLWFLGLCLKEAQHRGSQLRLPCCALRSAESQNGPALFFFFFLFFPSFCFLVGGFCFVCFVSLTKEKLLLGQRAGGCPAPGDSEKWDVCRRLQKTAYSASTCLLGSTGVLRGHLGSNFEPSHGYALGGITHLSWVSVITGLKQHQASFLAGAALGYQAFVGLQVVELQKKTGFLRTPMQTSWCLGDIGLLSHPSTQKDSGALGPSVDEDGLLRFGIWARYLHLRISMPLSYCPRSLKYCRFIANNPPAIVGDLKKDHSLCSFIRNKVSVTLGHSRLAVIREKEHQDFSWRGEGRRWESGTSYLAKVQLSSNGGDVMDRPWMATMTTPIKKLFFALPTGFRKEILWPRAFSEIYTVMERLQTTCTTPTSCQATQEMPPLPVTARLNVCWCSDIGPFCSQTGEEKWVEYTQLTTTVERDPKLKSDGELYKGDFYPNMCKENSVLCTLKGKNRKLGKQAASKDTWQVSELRQAEVSHCSVLPLTSKGSSTLQQQPCHHGQAETVEAYRKKRNKQTSILSSSLTCGRGLNPDPQRPTNSKNDKNRHFSVQSQHRLEVTATENLAPRTAHHCC
ncbi:hypothetical protein A6R68_09442 [Neotoma lepida]|uniref:SET domain-containing protein n=1 Tax=Neotoma lepida TaxID=56216 RepID=A0A1A6FZV0_NEOLE|nr:hypothetical protein A6R68_09442 [Neotoma lepida]